MKRLDFYLISFFLECYNNERDENVDKKEREYDNENDVKQGYGEIVVFERPLVLIGRFDRVP